MPEYICRIGKTIEDLKPGQKATLSKTVSEADIYMYLGITGDLNPLFLDETYARHTRFKGTIVPGVFTAGLVTAAIDMELPGPGTVTVFQDFCYRNPVRSDDTVTTEITVEKVDKEKNEVLLHCICKNQEGTLVLEGEVIAKPRPLHAKKGDGK
ncbi:MAG: MaoC family dehydratase [Chloroflexi bacterium]|nr:MaoC family dehydratase [Chloroflexota bacterium]